MRNPRGLKVRRYAAFLIDLNEYLDVFPGEKSSDFFVKDINEILLNININICIKQEYMQVFDC